MGSGTAGVEVTFTITGSLFESWQSLSDIYFTGKNNNEEKEVGNGPILRQKDCFGLPCINPVYLTRLFTKHCIYLS